MIFNQYKEIRERSVSLCADLDPEDYVIQAAEHVSPAKWHLAHTTWFFETFILKKFKENYQEYHADFSFLFNSYYNAVGERTARNQRGLMTRPTVKEILAYRSFVDEQMYALLQESTVSEMIDTVVLGLNHEQQHQELMLTDLKYNLSFNPLRPSVMEINEYPGQKPSEWLDIAEGIYEIGFEGDGFSFDNEATKHKVYLQEYSIASQLVTNGEYLEFINHGGYADPQYWHSDGWTWVEAEGIKCPDYWEQKEGSWFYYTLDGMKEIDLDAPVAHVSFYEAAAYAEWMNLRLPTEAEWETAAEKFDWGNRWEWTNSAYLPYPGFAKAPGAIGEYNGKFMVNQMVLRGSSIATSPGHSRATYRNFFHPHYRWQFTGIRLCKK